MAEKADSRRCVWVCNLDESVCRICDGSLAWMPNPLFENHMRCARCGRPIAVELTEKKYLEDDDAKCPQQQ